MNALGVRAAHRSDECVTRKTLALPAQTRSTPREESP